MSPMYKADEITKRTNGYIKTPCDVVAMTGFLAHDGGKEEHYRLYQSTDFTRWIAIGPDTIKAQAASPDARRKGQSVVWLDSEKTITLCEEAPVWSYQPHAPSLHMPGDEDLGLEYPKKG